MENDFIFITASFFLFIFIYFLSFNAVFNFSRQLSEFPKLKKVLLILSIIPVINILVILLIALFYIYAITYQALKDIFLKFKDEYNN